MHPAYTNKSVQAIFITAMDQMTARDVKRVAGGEETLAFYESAQHIYIQMCACHTHRIALHVCGLTLKPETTVQDCVLTTRYF